MDSWRESIRYNTNDSFGVIIQGISIYNFKNKKKKTHKNTKKQKQT